MKYVLFLLIFCSCGPAWHLKQSKRHEMKAILKGAMVKADTIYLDREVLVPEIKFDTVLRQVNFSDTIVVEKDKVVTKLKINTITKEIFVETKCPPDTIRIKVPVTIEKHITAKAGIKWWYLIISFIVGAIVGKFVIRLLI